jgi:hypothetical protein
MQCCLEGIEEISSKDGIIRVERVDNIEGDVLCTRFFAVCQIRECYVPQVLFFSRRSHREALLFL